MSVSPPDVDLARRARPATTEVDPSARPPQDRPGRALLLALAAAAAPPAIFLALWPLQRIGPMLAWVAGAGASLGVALYCRLRAAAYLVDEPARGAAGRSYALLDPARYAPAGRRFLRWQIAASILLLVWWFGGAALLAHRL